MLSGLRSKRALALFILTSFLPFSVAAQDTQGKFTRLSKGDPSPFTAWCFDDLAFAKIKAKIETQEEALSLIHI